MADDTAMIRRELRAHHRADLLYGERAFAGRYVLDGPARRLILPSPAEAARADEHRVLAPRDDDEAVQVLAIYETIDPRVEAACDRYLAYHGVPHELIWTAYRIEAVKWQGAVADGAELDLANPLEADEPRLVKRLNQSRDRLERLSRSIGGERVYDPLAVGVDPDGIDVRHRFDVLRIDFEDPAQDAGEAERRIDALLASAGDAS